MNSLYGEPNHSFYASKDSDSSGGSPVGEQAQETPSDVEKAAGADVFRYEDYRTFLRDRFCELQSQDPAFSQRGLARKAGIANPGFFNEVIKGRRRLSPAAAVKMANGLDLNLEESDYFSVMVEFAETREPRAKLAAGKRMVAMRNRKFFQTSGTECEPSEGLQEIVRELNRDWILQAAGVDVNPSQETPDLQPMSDSTLRSILDKLVDIREHAAETDSPAAQSAQAVRVNLQVMPRGSAGAKAEDQ